jgi:antitoxin (DNA-binding transcriptional repressor) of toxin-antitoxin stability system
MAKSKRRKAPGRVRETIVAPLGPVEVPASELKNDWHHWLERVAGRRETVVVTRYGKPIATLAPVTPPEPREGFFGSMRGSVLSYTDLISPIEGDDMVWTADEENVATPFPRPTDDE